MFMYDLHTYVHHLWEFEEMLMKICWVKYFWFVTTDASRLQNYPIQQGWAVVL